MTRPRPTLTARIIRVKCGPLRAAIWTAYFPCVVARYLWEMGRHARPESLAAIYLVGIDGINH